MTHGAFARFDCGARDHRRAHVDALLHAMGVILERYLPPDQAAQAIRDLTEVAKETYTRRETRRRDVGVG